MVRKPSGLLWAVLVFSLGLGFLGLRLREQNEERARHDAFMESCLRELDAFRCESSYMLSRR